MNLVEALQEANNKSRKFVAQLDETAVLLGMGTRAEDDPGLAMSKSITLHLIQQTEAAIASGDVLRMLAVADLHGIGQGD